MKDSCVMLVEMNGSRQTFGHVKQGIYAHVKQCLGTGFTWVGSREGFGGLVSVCGALRGAAGPVVSLSRDCGAGGVSHIPDPRDPMQRPHFERPGGRQCKTRGHAGEGAAARCL